MQCRGIGPLLVARGKSLGFSQVAAGTWVMFSSYVGDSPSKLMFVQGHQDSCLVARDTWEFSSRLCRAIGTPLDMRRETEGPFPGATGILGFLTNFKSWQASSPFETLNFTFLSSSKRDVRPTVEMRQGTRDFSRFSTGDSDNPSSCEMKDEPAFKSVQGNLALFRVRASRCPFHLRQHTQGPSHIPIAVRSLLLRCLWKGGIPLDMNPGNQLSSRDDLRFTELSSSRCAELGVPLNFWTVFSGNLWMG